MSVNDAARVVRVHINRETYESPNPTTGEALYILGDLAKHERLYRETSGDVEDILVPRDETPVELTEDEHLYSQKTLSIFVNGDEHEVEEREISYIQVVSLFLGSGGKPSNEYLVKYSHGPEDKPSGTLPPGKEVKVKDGMRFRVTGTGES